MKRLHIISLAVGLVLGLALHASVARAGPRPTSDLALMSQLNGAPFREANGIGGSYADGGGLSLWSADAGPGCNNVSTGAVYEMHCSSAGHFCPWGNDGGAGLAMCGYTIGNIAYGRPVPASTPGAPAPYYFVTPANLDVAYTNVCITPKQGDVTMTCALFRMR
jgi:hypothetical protein